MKIKHTSNKMQDHSMRMSHLSFVRMYADVHARCMGLGWGVVFLVWFSSHPKEQFQPVAAAPPPTRESHLPSAVSASTWDPVALPGNWPVLLQWRVCVRELSGPTAPALAHSQPLRRRSGARNQARTFGLAVGARVDGCCSTQSSSCMVVALLVATAPD
jgi:hypothetical protein